MMTYFIVVVSFTLGFIFSAILARNKVCIACENQQGIVDIEQIDVLDDEIK